MYLYCLYEMCNDMHRDRIWTLMSRKLSGEATKAELLELDELIKLHPEIDIPTQFVEEYWSIPIENDEEFLEATYHLHNERLKQKGYHLNTIQLETGSFNYENTEKSKRKKNVFIVSCIGLLLAISTLSFFYFKSTNNVNQTPAIAKSEVSTKNGSRTKIKLPDGTMVWLNSSSKLTYIAENFGSNIREVSLTGEAYFDVVKNASKPFIIHTAKMDIKVLGTAFNVKSYQGDKTTETSLIHGSVEVTLNDRHEKILMKPNEKLIINNDDSNNLVTSKNSTPQKSSLQITKPIIQLSHLTLYPTDNSIVETGWVNNKLIFTEETLEEIATKMERWYSVTVVIKNEKLKKELLTGSFEKETMQQALKALQFTTSFNYKIEKDTITITK